MRRIGLTRAVGALVLAVGCTADNPLFNLGSDGTADGGGTAGMGVGGTRGSVDEGSAGGTKGGARSGTADGSGMDDATECGDGAACLDIPDGWVGPVAIDSSNAAAQGPACAGQGLGELVRRGAAGRVSAPDCCACVSTPNDCQVQIQTFGDSSCVFGSSDSPPNACSDPPGLPRGAAFTFSSLSTPGSCSATTVDDPKATVEAVLEVCSVPTGMPCGSGECVPNEVGDGDLAFPCIVQNVADGDEVACPSGWDPEGLIRNVSSGYDCSGASCECGAVEGTLEECNASLVLYESGDCTGEPLQAFTRPGQCTPEAALEGVGSVSGVTDPGPLCVPSAPAPAQGRIEETDWLQICCRE